MRSRIRSRCFAAAAELLFPRRCVFCDEIVPFGQGLIHPACEEETPVLRGARCAVCARPLPRAGNKTDAILCADCRRRKPLFDKGFSVFSYRAVAESIYRFKYAGRREYAAYYAGICARLYGSVFSSLSVQALVPVPLYPAKKKQRGYNQAEDFARALSAHVKIPVRTDLIARVRDTIPLKYLDADARRNNLKKAFIMKKNDVELKSIVIVDDIYTTGSTVNEIAALCRRNGVPHIYVLSLAIGGGL